MSAIHGDLFTSDESGEWVTIREAARRLDVGERAVRRRVTRGEFLCRTHSNGLREVFLPASTSTSTADAVGRDVDPERAIELVDRMSIAVTRQLDALTVELSASRDRVESLARENGILTERAAGLERELNASRDASSEQRAASAGPPDSPTADEAELAAIRRTNQRQAEELARMAAELNAFRLAQEEAEEAGENGAVGPPSKPTNVPRPPLPAVTPWWTNWWMWVGIIAVTVCFLVLVRIVLG